MAAEAPALEATPADVRPAGYCIKQRLRKTEKLGEETSEFQSPADM